MSREPLIDYLCHIHPWQVELGDGITIPGVAEHILPPVPEALHLLKEGHTVYLTLLDVSKSKERAMENPETKIWTGNQAQLVPQCLGELEKAAKGRQQPLKLWIVLKTL